MSLFHKATKEKAKARVALIGPSGSGKTFTALRIAAVLAKGGKIAVIDSEHGSAAKYAHQFGFDHLVLDSYEPENYVAGIKAAQEEGYSVLVVDSLSHAWAGKGGILEFVDQQKRSTGDGFAVWGKATPRHTALVESLLSCEGRLHLIVTMRSKMEYVKEDDPNRPGKTRVRKIGMQPVQREGLEYEFDVVGDLDEDNALKVSKTRCSALAGQFIDKPGEELGRTLLAWLDDGVAPVEHPKPTPAPEPAKRPEDGPRVSQAQIKRLWVIAKESHGQDAENKVRRAIKDVAGVDHTADIPASLYDAVIDALTSKEDAA